MTMQNRLILDRICIGDNKIEYKYRVEGSWKQAFRLDNEFFIEYSRDFGRELPYGIAVIPFLGNFLPISWVFDAEIVIEEIDSDFFDSIDEIKRGYQWMYPQIEMRGRLTCPKITVYDIESGSEKSALYFSSGVDAYCSLVSVIKEKPILLTVWGTDVYLKDTEGWEKISEDTRAAAERFGLDHIFIKTSFRNVVNYTYLNDTIAKPNRENWWHGFQHGIALITHSAPLAYSVGIRRVYFSSSDTVKSSVKFCCSSHPAMDFNERFCGCRTIHEGFENTRQDKIRKVCTYFERTGEPVKLHVCWETRNGENCCLCEKCARTIFGIIAEGYEPNDFGFSIDKDGYNNIIERIKAKKIVLYPIHWQAIVRGLMKMPLKPNSSEAVKFIISEMKDKLSDEQVFYPTVFSSQVKDPHERVMFSRKIDNSSLETMFESVGRNTGNLIFKKALEKELSLEVLSIEECADIKPKHIITTDLIWITPNADYSYLIDQMNRFKESVYVPISVGLQAKDTSVDFKLSDSAKKVLNMIGERAVIGCRGEYTASVLEKNNIRNIEVIGCPSVFINGEKGYSISNDIKDPVDILCNFRTFFGPLSRKEKHFLSYCATRNYDFTEQTQYPFTIENTVFDEKYFNYVNKWLKRKTFLFFDADEWSSFAARHDFCMGSRFHGNVAAVWNNIPALFMPIDSRTREMVEYFGFPYIEMEDFDWEKPIEYYIEKADYSEFNRSYGEKYNRFVSFLKKNGLWDA